MITIGVLSDTHLADTAEGTAFLARLAARQFREATMILHAGDVVDHGVLAAFAPCPVYGVRGNMDPPAADFPVKRVVDAAGARIGLIHGWGPREGLVERVLHEFAGVDLDCLIFGHSHVPLCEQRNGLLLFNPGSATDRRGMAYASVGLLQVGEGGVSGRIVPLEG